MFLEMDVNLIAILDNLDIKTANGRLLVGMLAIIAQWERETIVERTNDGLMQMALEAARQVIGQTPTVDNSALIKQIQQLLQQEPLFSGKPQLRVHPDDLQRVDDMLGATLSLHGWRLRGDPTLHPGGCKVSADEGDLDASVATRWQELCRLAAPGVV